MYSRLKRRGQAVCPNPARFYKIKGLLPSVDRRKQAPSEFLADEHHYENP
jgi:hypothetical protein